MSLTLGQALELLEARGVLGRVTSLKIGDCSVELQPHTTADGAAIEKEPDEWDELANAAPRQVRRAG